MPVYAPIALGTAIINRYFHVILKFIKFDDKFNDWLIISKNVRIMRKKIEPKHVMVVNFVSLSIFTNILIVGKMIVHDSCEIF